MRIIKTRRSLNEETFQQTIHVLIELDISLELMQDMYGANPEDVEAELAIDLGEELVKLIKEHKYEKN